LDYNFIETLFTVSGNHSLTDDKRRELVSAAQKAQQMAYAPYSNYLVGAALLAADGKIYTGCNVENAAYPSTICAERVAVTKAVSEGSRSFTAIAVVTANGGFPCGTCRQVMNEFAPDALVIVADAQGNVIEECSLRDLLPHGFGPEKVQPYAAP
jgi:cytidine deaminase